MNIYGFNPNLSRNSLWQFAAFLLVGIGVLLLFSDTVAQMYTSNQQTHLGLILNGFILALFSVAVIRLLILLFHYRREELALAKFHRHLQDGAADPTYGVDEGSMVNIRYQTILHLKKEHATINHQALASALVAAESTRAGSIRFVHHVLILCGVFGTIVSLSIALFGASSLLESAVSSTGMGMVIHGMSTALSTTMTAIVCYIFLGYFFTALQQIQTGLLGALEQITTTRLLAEEAESPDAVHRKLYELMQTLAKLLQSMGGLTKQMQESQQQMPEMMQAMQQQLQQDERAHAQVMQQLEATQALLREGFRLQD
ncbi:MAG: hypothetical protein CO186_08725 [Zetaproteobacteria bacterium CG_4_9_14_3_um_filter_49_83]|nr:MAG: hypothetical protein AUJ56_04270 [Zetaproteobacteria bacterium CG1_02_49_23]PIQ31627.1 MAG: hypothetical protein COW62_09070 [Zetaproteobacteria bacterium CG17_big_fil_post_rev_8_21_14_2_50_50_13]PIV30040.1 MAG: hypothetical protein COS35_08755 [Zetaproteobacteria bacterium CG02_land_8_20_14_3_00_50_9]PIY55493.1 MAG: hypothetical protein COZ00_08975 [Zetaproteobacteria bacterium CG_4_10_14_0_8_um_filter_49_80]PJA34849.1 MAG: hypothetical protein CO186_08725 [Zetaproteobacteria bacterium